MKKLLYILFTFLILAPVTGELFRIPLFGIDFMLSDLIIPFIFIIWGIDKIHSDRKLRLGKIGKMIIIFLFILTITYFLNLFRFDFTQMVVGFSYMGRFGMYLVLAIIVFDLLDRDEKNRFRNLLLVSMIASMIFIVLFGFLQLKFFPDFLELGMHLKGWDPHIGRLLSTWFDPNFIGGYLAFMLGPIIAIGLYFRHSGNKKFFFILLVISLVCIIALYLTFSRSGYLALIATLVPLAFFKSRKLLIAFIMIAIFVFTLSPRVQDRTIEAWDSGKALIGFDSQKPLDPTAELRVYSWKFALEIIKDHPWLGVGYGRYAYEINARGHGLLSDHSAGGSDSSLLTIWAQTGIFGFLSVLSIGFTAFLLAFKRIWRKRNFLSYLNAGFLSSFCGIMVHSIFVNSLLYTLMMVYLWISLGILDSK